MTYATKTRAPLGDRRYATNRPSSATIEAFQCRIDELEGKLLIAKSVARNLWALLTIQEHRRLWEEVFTPEGAAVVDAAFDAAQRLADRERIHVEPCRRILHGQEESYLAVWPDGHDRWLTRAQLLMLGQQPADSEQINPPPKSLWQIAHA